MDRPDAANQTGGIGARPRPQGVGLPTPAADWALFLDVDGTLLAIAESPDQVVVSRRLRRILRRVAPVLGGAVALISGRTIATLDGLFAPLRLPSAGLHGLQRRDAAGVIHEVAANAELAEVRRALTDFAAAHPGVLLEDKGPALAVHYRQAPAAAPAARRLVDQVTADLAGDVRILHGKMLVEVASAQADKGTAIAAFMTEAPFAGRRPVFVGDDVTDEDGFAAVNRAGGYSIRVGPPDAASVAAYHIADVASVADWLEALPPALGAAPAEGRR